jgi:hypothetical protein
MLTGEQGKGTSFLLSQRKLVNGADKDESTGQASPNTDDSDQSAEHNLPESPFASPTKFAAFSHDPSTSAELEISAASSTGCNAPYVGTNNLRPSPLAIPSPKTSYFFPMSRLSSDHSAGAIGM